MRLNSFFTEIYRKLQKSYRKVAEKLQKVYREIRRQAFFSYFTEAYGRVTVNVQCFAEVLQEMYSEVTVIGPWNSILELATWGCSGLFFKTFYMEMKFQSWFYGSFTEVYRSLRQFTWSQSLQSLFFTWSFHGRFPWEVNTMTIWGSSDS